MQYLKIALIFLTMCLISGCASSPFIQTAAPVQTIETIQPADVTRPIITSTAKLTATSTEPAPTVDQTLPELDRTPTVDYSAHQAFIIDHRAVDLFETIPDEAIQAAAAFRLMYRHASVGENINFGLDCLRGNFPERRPSACSGFYDLKYNRDNWSFQFRGNPGWIEKVDDFITQVEQQINDYDIFTFSLGYVDGMDGGTYPIISEPENFNSLMFDKLEALEAAHPGKTFILWTMPLARVGYENTQKFNQMVRDYARENNKILFDIADIESHDPQGNKIQNDAGHDIIYQGYTDESRAGHLNTAGRERVAKAFWYLMARVAGWEGPPGGP